MGLGKQKTFFYWLTVGKNKCRCGGRTTGALGSVGLGGCKYVSEAFLFFYYICRMNNVELIGLVSAVLGILSFFGFGIPITSLFKKNLFLCSSILPYGLNRGSFLLKKI